MSEMKLPTIDGKPLVKPKAKSTDRHKREKLYKIAKNLQMSVATLRRGHYILKFGSEEIKELLRNNEVSVWRAYNYVKRQKEMELIEWILRNKK